tara:strand:+ start:467 stop:1474 length:1008 start_codon:yes stop_codon:yes gene_type:complete
MFLIKFIFGIISHKLINFILLRNDILLNDPNHLSHKKMINKKSNITLSGGLVFVLLFLIFPITDYNLKFFILLIFLIGLISDLKILDIPSLRFILQFFVITIFVYILDLSVNFTDLKYLDLFLEYKFLSLLFTILCFLVLINGSNFLDGLNSLVIVYYILVLISFLSLIKIYNLDYNLSIILNIILILFIILIFNLFNQSFIGDSGAYSISSIIGYIAIDFFKTNEDFSVVFIIVLLWYPAFETLFSIIRKFISKKNPIYPDNKHLHHRLFNLLNLKFKKNFFSNLTAALLINLFNLLIFFVAVINYKSSVYLSLILLFNAIIYIFLYIRLSHER